MIQHYDSGIAFGVWDLIHTGHINLLRNAKERCDYLVVGVTTDEACLARKGKIPVIPFIDRMNVVQAIRYVDRVVPQDEEHTKAYWVDRLQIDAIFVGDDWMGKEWDGAKLGIPVVYLPYTAGVSSTKIREERLLLA